MTIFGKAGAAIALVAMSTGAVPAEAQHRGSWHRGHDRIDGGDVLLGAVVAGGLFALLASGKKHEQASPPEESVTEEDQGAPVADPGPDANPADQAGAPRARTDEEAAVDACVASAEAEGRRYARVSKIDTVSVVDAVASDWIVRGTLALRDDYRAPVSDRRDFSCRVGERGVEQVTVDGAHVAAR